MAAHADVAGILAAVEEAWNQADAVACARLFAADAVYVTRSGVIWQGRPAIEDGHARAFAGPLADTTASLRPIHISFPAPSMAIAQVDVHLLSEASVMRVVTTFVLAFDTERWSIIAAHTSEIAAIH